MNKLVIMADTTCDLSEEQQQRYDVKIVPGHVVFPDKSEKLAYPDWESVPKEKMYADLKKNPAAYSTSPANVKEFTDVFEEYASKGSDILVITLSSGLSGAYNFACLAQKDVQEKYPDVTIRCVDSLRFGPGSALMVIRASELRAEGKSIDEIATYLEENRNKIHQAGWMDDLSFVAKKGRITHAKAFFGTLAGVKPIGEFDYNGMTTVIGKAKGARSAYAVLLHYIEQTVIDPENQLMVIAHSDRAPQAEEYKRLIEEKFHPREIYITEIFPSTAINIGPGLMALYYTGKPISQGLVEEREILNSYVKK